VLSENIKEPLYQILFLFPGPWSEHGTSWYNCNRYDEKSSHEARDSQTQSRASLERYLHVSALSLFPHPLCSMCFRFNQPSILVL
jgi:hypothetical protein